MPPLIQHPPHPRDLQQTLRDRIPTLDDLYNDYPQTTPLFLVNELLHSVSDALDDPDVPRTKLEYMLLMCLHRDWPANQPVQSPNAPPGPTVDYVRDREAWTVVLGERLVYATECARVCLSDGLKGRSERFGHAVPREPTARMFKSMAMLVSIELASILEHLHIDIASVVLKGKWAIEVANLQPKVRRVELSPIRRNSTTFDSQVSNDYHPRVSMTSNHLPVRSLHLARECLRDELDGVNWIGPHQIPAGAIYDRRGPTLNIGVDTWQNIIAALNLDVNDPASAFDIVSRALQDYVSEFGTGTHGGGAGPNVYAGYPWRAGGGCSIRRRKKPVPASERDSSAALPRSDAPEEELILSEILEKQDLVKMEELLIGAGYAVEDVDGPALSACFDAVMPCLELLDRISDLDSGSALDLVAANHPALLRPETAERALELFDAGLPDEQLGSRLALLADEAVSSVKAGTTTTAAAAETEFATSRQEQAPDAEAPASVPGSRARASAEAQGGDADALRPCTAPATSPKPLMVSDPQQLTDVTRTAGQKRPAELQIDAAPAKRPYQQISGQLPQPAMPPLQEVPGGEARPNGSGLDKNLDHPPSSEDSVQHLSPPHLTAADEHGIEDELSRAADGGDVSLGPCAVNEPRTEMSNPLQSDSCKSDANSATAYDSVAADRPLSQLERRIARLTVETVPIHELGPAVALVQTPAYGAPISDEVNTRVTISSSPQTSSSAAPPTPPESLRVTGPAGAACTEKRSAEPLASSSAKRPRQQSPSPEGVGVSQEAAKLSEEGLTASNFGPTYPQPRDPSDPNAFKGAIAYVWKGSFRGSLPFRDVVADSWSADAPISVSTLKVWTEHMISTPHLRNVRAIVATRTATAPVPLVTIRVIFYNNDQFLRFAADQAIRRQTLKPEDDFYKFHNHYWRRHLRIENWASKEDGPSRYLPTGTDPARMPLFTPLNARDPNLESTEPDFVERIPGYPKPSSDQQRFMGKILRSPIHPTANFQAGYSIDNVLRGSTSDQAMADSTLVALAEGIVPPTHISNVRFIGTANTGYDSYGAPLARVAIVFTTNAAYKSCMDSLVEEYGTSKPSQQPFLSWHNNFMRSLHSGIATDPRNTFTPFLKRPSFH